ncbi:MAG TPA: RHS repeat-associated core domain-containing protein, partial [Acidimicrobiia bacterium]
YDAYGNLTSHASAVNANTTLTYDLADRLLTTVLPGPGNTTTAFTLDALGRIATRTPPGGSAEPFSYLGTSETVWAIGGVTPVSSALDPAGTRLASQSGATTGFLLTDLHGNLAAATTSGETALLSATRYDPFGVTSASWDGGAGLPTPWKFQARLDLTSNPSDPLYEFSARYYLPAVGAFSQLDSYAGDVGDPLSLHRYLYAAANPWTLIDPTGHYFISGLEAEDSQKAVYLPAAGTAGNTTREVHVISTPVSHATPTWTATAHSWMDLTEGYYNWFSGARSYASGLGTLLREGDSTAARLLPDAGAMTRAFGGQGYRLLGRGLLLLGLPLEYSYQRDQGRDEVESAVRTVAVTAGSLLFAGVGAAGCAGGAVASLGVGAAACPVLVAGGALAGGYAGDRAIDLIIWVIGEGNKGAHEKDNWALGS